MPDLRMREQTSEAELQAIADQSAERAACLRLAETVADFLSRLRSSAGTLNVPERQRVVRLLVKEIFVGDDKIVIRHSIPLPANPTPEAPIRTGIHRGQAKTSPEVIFCVQRCATGDVIVVRYADDSIVGFEHRHEAEQFLADLKARLARFGLKSSSR